MIVVIALGVIGFGVVALGGLAIGGTLRDDRSTRRDTARGLPVFGGTGPMVAFGGVVLVIVLLGAAGMTLIGLGGGEDVNAESSPAGPTRRASSTTASTTTTTSTSTSTAASTPASVPARPLDRDPIEGPDVTLEAVDRDAFATESAVVDRVARRSVLRITARGFTPNATGLVEQCTLDSCANAFPVLFDEVGTARLQYLVRDDIVAADGSVSTCRADEPPCVVRLRTEVDSAFLTTVFRDAAPTPRRVTVTASARGIVDDATVTVKVRGFTPGRRVHATLCAAPDTAGTKRCGAPGPVVPFTIGADGTGGTSIVIRSRQVGSDRAHCGRDAPCGIVVNEESSALPAPVVLLTFASGPSARYDASRLAIGLALGCLLLALAFLLVRLTDWRKPTEADTPELDQAVLTDI
jgi:hypothetical protein